MNEDNRELFGNIGRAIRAYRKERRLTQEELAKIVGVTRTSITNIEGGTSGITVPLLDAIAATLCVSVDTLMGRDLIPDRKEIVTIEGQDVAVSPVTAYKIRKVLEDV